MSSSDEITEQPLVKILDRLLSDQSTIRYSGELFLQNQGSSAGFIYGLIAYACTGKEHSLSAFCVPCSLNRQNEKTEGCSGSSAIVCDLPCKEPATSAAFSEDFDSTIVVSSAVGAAPCEDIEARRTLAAVLAKQFIRERWVTVEDSEKNAIKSLLLYYIIRLPAPIRRTLYVVIAQIAAIEGPKEGWPLLFPTIRHLMHQCREKHITCGMITLLDLLLAMVQEPGATLAVHILDTQGGVQDALLHLAQGMRQFNFTKQHQEITVPESCRRTSLHIYQLSVQSVIEQWKTSRHETERLILGNLQQWTTVFLELVEELSTTPTDLNAIQNTLIVLRCLATLFSGCVPTLERECATCLRTALEKILEVLDGYYLFYENMVINDHDGDASVEESTEGGPTSFVIQLCELLTSCASRTRLRHSLIKNHVRDILGALIKYFQVNEAQKNLWLEDGNEFLFHEVEGGRLELSIRVAGETLINELLEHFQEETTEVLIDSSMALFNFGGDKKDEQRMIGDHWKFWELGLWLMGLVASTDYAKALYTRREFEITVLQVGEALGNPASPPLLRARALLTVTKLRNFLTVHYPNDILNLLVVSATAIQPSEPPPVRIAACRALDAFLAVCESKEVKLNLMLQRNVLESVADFLSTAAEDSLRLGIDLVTRLFLECPTAMEAVRDSFLPLVIEVWRRSSEDPLVNVYFQEFLITACQSSAALRKTLEGQLLPLIMKTLRTTALEDETEKGMDKLEPHNLNICLDLYSVLIRTAPSPLHSLLWEGFEYLMLVLMKMDEASVVQTGCEALALLIITASTHIREENRLHDILVFAERLLSPGLEDRAALMAGPLLQVFIRQFGADLPADLIRRIFSAMLTRMVTAEVPALQQSLMLVFSRFVCQSPDQMFAILDSISISCDDRSLPGFMVFVTFWLRWLPSADRILRNPYARNVTYLALVNVLTRRRPKEDTPPTVIYETLRLLIHGLRTICRQTRQRDRGLKERRDMGDATVPSPPNDTPTEDPVVPENELNAESSADSPQHSTTPTYWSEEGTSDTSSSDNSEITSFRAASDVHCVSLLHNGGYRSIFSEEEEKDPFHSIDIKSLLYAELKSLQDCQNPYSNVFQTLDPTTLNAWASCERAFRDSSPMAGNKCPLDSRSFHSSSSDQETTPLIIAADVIHQQCRPSETSSPEN